MYSIVKRFREIDGTGVVVDVEWFMSDPSNDRDMMPDLVDQVIVPVPTIDRMTDADLEEALRRREPAVRVEVAPKDVANKSARAPVRAMLGRARRIEGNRQ